MRSIPRCATSGAWRLGGAQAQPAPLTAIGAGARPTTVHVASSVAHRSSATGLDAAERGRLEWHLNRVRDCAHAASGRGHELASRRGAQPHAARHAAPRRPGEDYARPRLRPPCRQSAGSSPMPRPRAVCGTRQPRRRLPRQRGQWAQVPACWPWAADPMAPALALSQRSRGAPYAVCGAGGR